MAKVMDPHIAAIMAQYDTPSAEGATKEGATTEKKKPPPPTNYEEFMKVEGLVMTWFYPK
jgi:hypothetical protein